MSDAAFKTAPYPAYTTAELGLMLLKHEERRVILPAKIKADITAEIERRKKRDAGDVSVMTDGERLRNVKNGG